MLFKQLTLFVLISSVSVMASLVTYLISLAIVLLSTKAQEPRCTERCYDNSLPFKASHRDPLSRLDAMTTRTDPRAQCPWEDEYSSHRALLYAGTEGAKEQHCHILGRKANCSCLCFREVPQNLSTDILELDLSYNLIASVPSNAFSIYPQLQRLNVSYNSISTLDKHAFSELSQLISLDLYNNSLQMNNVTFLDGVFCPLKSLTFLRINRNNWNLTVPGLKYPATALSCLPNLEELHMDGLPVQWSSPFQKEFKNLSKLKTLNLAGYMDGYCDLRYLNNNTFENLETVEILNIADCRLYGNKIQAGAFVPLQRLKSLNLTHNEDIDIDNLNSVFYGLQKAPNFTHLQIPLIVNRYSVGFCLESYHIQYMPQSLTYLDAGENNIEAISPPAIGLMPPNLQTLDLSGNRFVFGAYLKYLPTMKNLKQIRLNGATFEYRLPKVYPYNHRWKHKYLDYNCSLYLHKGEQFILELPPQLETIEMQQAGLRYCLSELYVNETNNLRSLSLSNNHFRRLEGPLYGLHKLSTFDVSSCYVSFISSQFFQNLTTLHNLNLSSNILGSSIDGQSDSSIFSALKELRHLDLSFNDIRAFPGGIFSSLSQLRTLNLSKNSFFCFGPSIVDLHHLRVLDLSSTHITQLSMETQMAIDRLVLSGVRIQVPMENTPLACGCDNYNFLQWMVASPAFHSPDLFGSYQCVDGPVKYSITDGYNSTLTRLKRKCLSNLVVLFSTGSLTILAVVMIIAAILYRSRWNIQYLYYAAYLWVNKNAQGKTSSFDYDAFICYAQEDMDFAEHVLDKEFRARNLKAFLHRRDFTAGELISSNIVKAVSCCKKTVVLLTKSLMESHWCVYEIEMAKMEGLYTGRKVLLFIIMDRIPTGKLKKQLLYDIKTNTYLEYPVLPAEENQLELWWDKLANDIRD